MNSIKCPSCGFISWAKAETCRKCGGKLSVAEALVSAHEVHDLDTDADHPIARFNISQLRKHRWIVLAVLIALTVAAFKSHRADQPQTFTIEHHGQRTSKVWFRSWFSSDPSADEIFAQYLNVSGRQANPSALKTYIAKGRFELKNQEAEIWAETLEFPSSLVRLRWGNVEGEVEFEAQAPNKFIFTQKFVGSRVFQRGTNGTTGWWKKGWWSDPSSVAGPNIQFVHTVITDELDGDNLVDLKRGSDFINYFQLGNTYSQLYVAGKTLVGERVAYEVQNRTNTEAVMAMYFDVETGMLLRFDSYRPEQPYNPALDGYRDLSHRSRSDWSHVYLEDYREVNGVQIPFLIRQDFRDVWLTTAITEFKANPAIDSSVFEEPPHPPIPFAPN